MIMSIIHAEGFEEMFGVVANSSLAARIEGTADQRLLEVTALSSLAAPSQETPAQAEEKSPDLGFGVNYEPVPSAKDLVKRTEKIQKSAERFAETLAEEARALAKRTGQPALLLAPWIAWQL